MIPALSLVAPACGSRAETGEGSAETSSGTSSTATTDGSGTDGTSTGGTSTGGTTTGGTTTTGGPPPAGGVDVLFVVDNSGSMGTSQVRLVQGARAMAAQFELEGTDFRMAFTTTDNGNPWCGGTTPEAGGLVYSSCRDRIGSFTSQSGAVNVQAEACENLCPDGTSISGTDFWLESVAGQTNLGGASVNDALGCLLPQGINGCGFESQLESFNKTLIRSFTPDDNAFGFIRDDANLLIVVATDEADCSYNNSHVSIFEQTGARAFWWDPNDTFPSSAVCWNAGVACSGDPSAYDCQPQNYLEDGSLIPANDPNADSNAVLHPVSRYTSRINGIRNDKRALDPNLRVEVLNVAGYTSQGGRVFADTADAVYMHDFGIGPGCSRPGPGTETLNAIPPVRLEAVRAGGSTEFRVSICDENWSTAFAAAASDIGM